MTMKEKLDFLMKLLMWLEANDYPCHTRRVIVTMEKIIREKE